MKKHILNTSMNILLYLEQNGSMKQNSVVLGSTAVQHWHLLDKDMKNLSRHKLFFFLFYGRKKNAMILKQNSLEMESIVLILKFWGLITKRTKNY